MKIKHFIILVPVILFSCKTEEMDLPTSFPDLNGKYEYKYYSTWENGLYEDYRYETWEFDKTRNAWNYWKYWSYTESGWHNALKESGGNSWEWKIENNVFYRRYWNTKGAQWKTFTFEYINSNSFKLDGKTFSKVK